MLPYPYLTNSRILSSSWPWLTPVTTSTSAWIPITPATPSPTVASASRSTETGRSTTCTWGRRVGHFCSCFTFYQLNSICFIGMTLIAKASSNVLFTLLLSIGHSVYSTLPHLSTLGSVFQESTHWLTSCLVWGRMTPPPPGRPPAGTYLFTLSLTTGAIKGTVIVINIPGRPADKKINFNCERKGNHRGNEMS